MEIQKEEMQQFRTKKDAHEDEQSRYQRESQEEFIDITQLYSSNIESLEEKQKVIKLISADVTIPLEEKDRRRQAVFVNPFFKRRKLDRECIVEKMNETSDEPSFSKMTDETTSQRLLGCEHYARKCRLKAECCGAWVVCRHCHDEHPSMDHNMDRFKTRKVKCMVCHHVQDVQETCEKCDTKFARYFCGTCKFYDNTPGKRIYHCDECKLCHIGEGIGIDNFHCKTCDVCVKMNRIDQHVCNKNNLDGNCPICGVYFRHQTGELYFMKCGHIMHKRCFDEYTRTYHTCPLCHKALKDMSEYYKRIDKVVANQSISEDVKDKVARVLCHDCDKKTETQFDHCYLKCTGCGGYNTSLI